MYPLGMTRSLAVVAGALALAVPSAASAASLSVAPQKACYSAGESVNLLGSGFSPLTHAKVTRDGKLLGSLKADGNGAFNGVLTLAQGRGKRAKTYTATDGVDQTRTASAQITVSSVGVSLKPANGSPGRVMTVTAHGFTTGKTLWAHIIHRKSRRDVEIGELTGACGNLEVRRRLLRRKAGVGIHTIQFDTFRRYKRGRPVQDRYTIAVSRG
ncbi:MAG: hypothetical protein QOE69_1919 [Thermoleophilaceae bacterium]|nr:hypothetical protein [Thermoleophilaceae bacterium]MEA2407800.1 hypothetical protein [Thermoleophilaceae bacterium]